ncbi:MAG: VWA domain-containing protein [Candidatus Acidiferrales bacterium]
MSSISAIIRSAFLGILISTFLIPAGELTALAQESGPVQPTQPTQQQPAQEAPAPQAQPPAASSGAEQQTPAQQAPPNGYSISVTVPEVNVDVVVTDNNGTYLPGLKKENFRVFEDNVPQTITSFAPTEAPITIVLLVEFSTLGGGFFFYNGRNWAAEFLGLLRPNDWVALEDYSMQTHVDVDFTHNTNEIMQSLSTMIFPPFHEANMFDALSDTIDRLRDVKGKKAILLLGTGIDTFSKLTLDKIMAELKETDVSIYFVSTAGANTFQGQPTSMTFLQAQNELNTFAKLTGGRAWFPNFEGEIPDIFKDVAASLRSQYTMSYIPSNKALDGKYRKIRIDLTAPDGGPLTVLDQKGKKVKFYVYARQGYVAPKSNIPD